MSGWGQVVDISKSRTFRDLAEYKKWQESPAAAIKNADCSFQGYFRDQNGIGKRINRWIGEKAYVVEVNWYDKIFTMLSFLLICLTLFITVSCVKNGFKIQIVAPGDRTYSEKTLKNLNTLHSDVSSGMKMGVSSLVFAYTMWCVFKRTTRVCQEPYSKSKTNVVAVDF